jgi:hypothetical protein
MFAEDSSMNEMIEAIEELSVDVNIPEGSSSVVVSDVSSNKPERGFFCIVWSEVNSKFYICFGYDMMNGNYTKYDVFSAESFDGERSQIAYAVPYYAFKNYLDKALSVGHNHQY